MKTQFNSTAVKNEVLTANLENKLNTVKVNQSFNWELTAALASLGAIIATVFVLSHLGLISNF